MSHPVFFSVLKNSIFEVELNWSVLEHIGKADLSKEIVHQIMMLYASSSDIYRHYLAITVMIISLVNIIFGVKMSVIFFI